MALQIQAERAMKEGESALAALGSQAGEVFAGAPVVIKASLE